MSVPVPPAVRITSLVCPTAARPESLARCLDSYVDNAARFGRRDLRVVVVDGAVASAPRAATQAVLARLQARTGSEVAYAGVEEKLRFAKRLVDTKAVPADVVKFGLFGLPGAGVVTIGANRNAALLATAGEGVLSVDDDTLCNVGTPPAVEPGIDVTRAEPYSSSHPWELWTAGTTSEADGAAVGEVDLLGGHERVLGRPVADCLAQGGQAGGGGEVDPAARVLVTSNSLVGDCGWGSPTHYLFVTGRSLERLTGSDETYRVARRSRWVLRGVRRLTLCQGAENLMTTFYGLDNRTAVAPFLPVARGSDYVFGTTLSECRPAVHVGHLPWTLEHRPQEARAFWEGEVLRSVSGFSLDVMISILLRASCRALPASSSGVERLYAVGQVLEHESAAPRFGEWAAAALAAGWVELSARLQRRLATAERTGSLWASDLACYLERGSAALASVSAPVDLLHGRREEEAAALFREIVSNFGRLLQWWPEMVDVSLRLSSDGATLVRRL
jgi:hypothetical protein